jgi:transposase
MRRLLTAAGRQRNIDVRIDHLRTTFAGEQMRQLPRVEAAFGERTRALILRLDAACRAADQLAQATEKLFTEHPDAAVLTSFPIVRTLTGARILAEIAEDRTRFAQARNLRAYAGSALKFDCR